MSKYYVYTSAKDLDDLMGNINYLVDQGYEPFGTVYESLDNGLFNQTMMKNLKENSTATDCLMIIMKNIRH